VSFQKSESIGAWEGRRKEGWNEGQGKGIEIALTVHGDKDALVLQDIPLARLDPDLMERKRRREGGREIGRERETER